MICVSLPFVDEKTVGRLLDQKFLVEVRLDLAKDKSAFCKVIKKYKQIIVTYRGGDDIAVRAKFFEKAIDCGIAYVDLDITDSELKNILEEKLKNSPTRLILSYHNFDVTPAKEKLVDIYEKCRSEGADIVKIVTMSNGVADNAVIMSLYEFSQGDIIAFGMGNKGKITRIIAPFLGAPFTYACYSRGKKTAQGQIDYKSLKDMIATIEKYL
ncbi:MAG TPA: type I 3-dehydroquinate dehydratase [Candidatus Marinimicrobia bacterium]|nr:type I 3-dehydroquinate dehydratase [Candidatus Neomarinimicrobiota bacterium]